MPKSRRSARNSSGHVRVSRVEYREQPDISAIVRIGLELYRLQNQADGSSSAADLGGLS